MVAPGKYHKISPFAGVQVAGTFEDRSVLLNLKSMLKPKRHQNGRQRQLFLQLLLRLPLVQLGKVEAPSKLVEGERAQYRWRNQASLWHLAHAVSLAQQMP